MVFPDRVLQQKACAGRTAEGCSTTDKEPVRLFLVHPKGPSWIQSCPKTTPCYAAFHQVRGYTGYPPPLLFDLIVLNKDAPSSLIRISLEIMYKSIKLHKLFSKLASAITEGGFASLMHPRPSLVDHINDGSDTRGPLCRHCTNFGNRSTIPEIHFDIQSDPTARLDDNGIDPMMPYPYNRSTDSSKRQAFTRHASSRPHHCSITPKAKLVQASRSNLSLRSPSSLLSFSR